MEDSVNETILTEIWEAVKRIEEKLNPTSAGKSEVTDLHCNEHGVAMEKKWSEKKQKNYVCHRNEEGQICFGKGFLAKG